MCVVGAYVCVGRGSLSECVCACVYVGVQERISSRQSLVCDILIIQSKGEKEALSYHSLISIQSIKKEKV